MKKVIEELNEFLEGNYMAIHTYDQYIFHCDDKKTKQLLQKIQQQHKEHAAMIAERIQNLGGIPVHDVGLTGKMAEMAAKIKRTKDTISMIKDAISGETRGIETSKKILDGDLDEESLRIVKEILKRDEDHVKLLKNYLNGSVVE